METANTLQPKPTTRRATRVLFVDDDPVILSQLRQVMSGHGDGWEPAYAPNGEAALTLLDAAPFDVIVSDLNMPKMDGATLLKTVCDRFPGTIRIVLSSATEMDAAFRAVPVAHQFLLKPCAPQTLVTAIQRAASLFSLLNNQLLANIVGSVKDLPVLPRTYLRLRTALLDPETSMKEIVRIVERDVGISAKILQLVNSALFGLPRQVSSLQTAVGFLGIDMLQNLVLSAEVFSVCDEASPVRGFSFEDLQEHSQLVAGIAGHLPVPAQVKNAAVVAGLLHDIGKLVLSTRVAKHFERAIQGTVEEGLPLHVVERNLISVSHAEVGAYLLGMWGLPAPVVEAVAHHHDPSRIPRQELDAVTVVHIADFLAHQRPVRKPAFAIYPPPLDMALIGALKLADVFGEWEKVAELAAHELAHAPVGKRA